MGFGESNDSSIVPLAFIFLIAILIRYKMSQINYILIINVNHMCTQVEMNNFYFYFLSLSTKAQKFAGFARKR